MLPSTYKLKGWRWQKKWANLHRQFFFWCRQKNISAVLFKISSKALLGRNEIETSFCEDDNVMRKDCIYVSMREISLRLLKGSSKYNPDYYTVRKKPSVIFQGASFLILTLYSVHLHLQATAYSILCKYIFSILKDCVLKKFGSCIFPKKGKRMVIFFTSTETPLFNNKEVFFLQI